jgi:hypothetical protein
MAIILNGTTGTVEASWTTATRPASPVAGQMGFNTTISAMETYTGSAWVTSDLPAPGSSGNLLQSNGTAWVSATVSTQAFPSGTRMSFQQTAAPTGWTKDTTAAINDSILRLVTGTASNGGATAFSSWAAITSTSAYTLATADIPSHTHGWGYNTGKLGGNNTTGLQTSVSNAQTSGATGGGGSHSHGVSSQNLKYYDFIIASAN